MHVDGWITVIMSCTTSFHFTFRIILQLEKDSCLTTLLSKMQAKLESVNHKIELDIFLSLNVAEL